MLKHYQAFHVNVSTYLNLYVELEYMHKVFLFICISRCVSVLIMVVTKTFGVLK